MARHLVQWFKESKGYNIHEQIFKDEVFPDEDKE